MRPIGLPEGAPALAGDPDVVGDLDHAGIAGRVGIKIILEYQEIS